VNKKELTREYNGRLSELRKIINSFDLISGVPSDEFDHLNHKLLSQLYKEIDTKKIKNILESELVIHYGLFENDFDAVSIVDKILNWWDSKY
jgi:hypothetical protein